MMKKSNFNYDCTHKCRYNEHGNQITTTMTKTSIDNNKLAAFIAKSCCNFANNVDDMGRSALHMAASLGQYEILEWLLNQGAIINACDYESGSSALHRSIFYGNIDCAVLLLRYGSADDLKDKDGYVPLDGVCHASDFHRMGNVSANNDIVVWGSNKYYNIGIGNADDVSLPQSVAAFRKNGISIVRVALGEYHSLFVDGNSNLYAVGHGLGGRLGNGSNKSLAYPKKVKVVLRAGEKIHDVSVSRYHSLLLSNYNNVYACGLNGDEQLGLSLGGKDSVWSFKEIDTLCCPGLMGIIARDCHSLTYSRERLYVWGTNHGQMGITSNCKVVSHPEQVDLRLPLTINITIVAGNSFSTVIYATDNVNIHFHCTILYYKGKRKSIILPSSDKLKDIAVTGGSYDCCDKDGSSGTTLKLLILTQTDAMYLWNEETKIFIRCFQTTLSLTVIDKILYASNHVLMLSKGFIYKGKCVQTMSPRVLSKEDENTSSPGEWCNSNKSLSHSRVLRMDMERMPHIDRAVDICCNEDLSSFAVLKESSLNNLKMPTLVSAEAYSFKKLYDDIDASDAVHDIIFHIDNESYPAHRFIVYSRASGLRKIIIRCGHKDVPLKFDQLTGKMFEFILKNIYTNDFPNEEDLRAIHRSLSWPHLFDRNEVVQVLLHFVEMFEINHLAAFLKSNLQEQIANELPTQYKRRYPFQRLQRTDYPELYDVKIICSDGIRLDAHKCILVARLDFFRIMFLNAWCENVVDLSTVAVEYMQPILDFLYSSDVEHFRKQQYASVYLYNMLVHCDQFFIERLRTVCEILLLARISTQRCAEMLNFATRHNCEVLQAGCLEFICQNLWRLLQHRDLDDCDPLALQCINKFYRQKFKDVFDYRRITPDPCAMDDEKLLSFVAGFEVDLSHRLEVSHESSDAIKDKKGKSMAATRRHELVAISSMKQSMDASSSTSPDDGKLKSVIAIEVLAANERLYEKAKSWMTVQKDPKKKKKEFVALSKESQSERKEITPEKDVKRASEGRAAMKSFISLSDFPLSTSLREKLPQKQMKRLSSERLQGSTANATGARSSVERKEDAATQPSANPWAAINASPPLPALSFSSSGPSPVVLHNTLQFPDLEEPTANSHAKAHAENKRLTKCQEYAENKLIALIQIEENAMAELRKFYNVDNVTDETITVERKTTPRITNVAVWLHK